MNKEKQQFDDRTGATTPQSIQAGINAHQNKTAPYTWEITRVHKKRLSKQNTRFLLLTINVPTFKGKVRSYQSYKEIEIAKLEDKETFEAICAIGFEQMKKQLQEKGVDLKF